MIIRKRSDFSTSLEMQLQNRKNSNDKKILIDNLRELADILENENPSILNIGFQMSYKHNVPFLILEIDE
jgi:hypothetical protein